MNTWQRFRVVLRLFSKRYQMASKYDKTKKWFFCCVWPDMAVSLTKQTEKVSKEEFGLTKQGCFDNCCKGYVVAATLITLAKNITIGA